MNAHAKFCVSDVNDDNSNDFLIHVRIQPNAEVFTIDRCPENVSANDWFARLQTEAAEYYQVFAGGRGFFRLPRERFESILKGVAA